MRFIIAPEFHDQMLQQEYHSPDCFVRPGEYLHHMYIEGVKYVVVPALLECLQQAEAARDQPALRHLALHKAHYDALMADALRRGNLEGVTLLGDPPPDQEEAVPHITNPYTPQPPGRWEDLGLPLPILFEIVLRTIYNRGQLTGGDLAIGLCIPYPALGPVLAAMRKQTLIDIIGQKGSSGDASYIYEIKPPKGSAAVQDALAKTSYFGPVPVTFDDYAESVLAQSIKKLVVTRRSIHKAFQDLIITDEVFNEIGPAINSAASIFFFGFPGNGKTSIAERITRLTADEIYIPYAVEANGQIIQLYDPILHTLAKEEEPQPEGGVEAILRRPQTHDHRYAKIKRPTIIVGGELTLNQLDLRYNATGKYYEAPLQMKANGGIFMIDDFGRQQMRPTDLLNRWIVPLEKRYDYLNTVIGTKIEVPFDQLLIFSTNLDPNQLADEAFLRRIKYKIEIRDPDESQFRQIWELVCKQRRIEYDERGVDYLIEKWYRAGRPFRMCQARDLLDQMMSMAKYNMERVNFSPDLIDAACATYFIRTEKRDFGARIKPD